LVKSKNRIVVTALREVAAGRVLPSYQKQDDRTLDLPH
jgi:hypothetical protein